MSETSRFKWNIEKENSFSLNDVNKDQSYSIFFRKILSEKKYSKFDGKKIKGNLCYDAYYKELLDSNGLRYTIYCYCYNIKEIKKIIEDPQLLEFSFEVQMESLKGIIGLEAIQWDLTQEENTRKNIEYFESRCEEIWKLLGSKYFSTF